MLPFLAEHALEGIQRALLSELAVTTISLLVLGGTSSTTISASGGTNDTEDNEIGNNHNIINNNNDSDNNDDDDCVEGGGHTNIAIMQLLLDMPYLPRPHSSYSMAAAAYYQHYLKHLGATRSSRRAPATAASSRSTTDLSVENHNNNPKLSRGGVSSGCGDEEGQERIANMLAERIALRLLEDVTVDACVKEGEDELLGELNLLDDNNHDEDDEREQKDRPSHGKKARR